MTTRSVWVGWFLTMPQFNEPILRLTPTMTPTTRCLVRGGGGGHGGGGYHGGGAYHGGGYGGYRGGYGYGGYGRGYGGYGYGRGYGYGGYWGGYGGYWAGYGLGLGLGYGYSYPYYYGGYSSPYYYAPTYYYTAPAYYYGMSATSATPVVTLATTPYSQRIMPRIDDGTGNALPSPRLLNPDGTYKYDGGPTEPVPMPKTQNSPKQSTERFVSIPAPAPAPKKYTYAAYGQQSAPKPAASDDVKSIAVK